MTLDISYETHRGIIDRYAQELDEHRGDADLQRAGTDFRSLDTEAKAVLRTDWSGKLQNVRNIITVSRIAITHVQQHLGRNRATLAIRDIDSETRNTQVNEQLIANLNELITAAAVLETRRIPGMLNLVRPPAEAPKNGCCQIAANVLSSIASTAKENLWSVLPMALTAVSVIAYKYS